MVWANVNFLGCQYSSRVQDEVEYYPVPEENEIERWLKVHPDILDDEEDARNRRQIPPPTSKRPTPSNPQLTSEEESLPTSKKSKIDPPDSSDDLIPFEALTDQLGSFISMIRSKKQGTDQSGESDRNIASKNWNQSNNQNGNPNNYASNKHTPNEMILSRDEIIKKFGKICLCISCFPEDINISRLSFLASKSRLDLRFEFPETEPFSPLSLYIGDCLMGKWSGTSKKGMKQEACTEIIAQVLAYQEREDGSPPICPASKQTIVDKNELMGSSLRIDEGNKGHQLLLKMGWKGEGGLGSGQTDPLVLVEPRTNSKQGFGGSAGSLLSQDEIRARLTKFLSNKDETQLRFPAGLSSEDRKLIHKLSGQYNLLHKSYGKDSERYMTVTKRSDHIESDRITKEPYWK